jgi:subtilisin family serine protease
MALIATGTAAICLGLSAMPASADQVRNQEWWLSSLRVTSAWAASQGAGVTVAVLSDGVNASAADLTGAVTTGTVPTGFPAATGQYLGELGNPIASLIAGRGHGPAGKSGIVGVAPKARILSIPVTLPPDDPELAQSTAAAAIPSAIAAGIRYAVNHGATVIDLPIDPGQAGSSGTGGATAAAGGSAAERDAVNFALAHKVVLVAPAGDNQTAGDAANFPAAYPGVIAVGAFNSSFTKAAWSSHRSYVSLTAPGAGVIAADNSGGYQPVNSTSAASAVVSGVAALIRSRYPSLTPAEVRQVLITTTTYRRPGPPVNGSGYGAVNAGKAMAAAAALAAPPGQRSAAGALPREAPAALPAPASSQGVGAQIIRAAEISGSVLL